MILEIIGQDVALRKGGKEWWGLCPFHAEKTPSFCVNEEKGLFYCHGCHVGGDLIRYLEKAKGLSFEDAAHIAGKPLDPQGKRHALERKQAKAQIEAAYHQWTN